MSDDLADVLDLDLAWQRVRAELASDLEILATAETQPAEENLGDGSTRRGTIFGEVTIDRPPGARW